jgi:MYXO-CTERM domain-containing protein
MAGAAGAAMGGAGTAGAAGTVAAAGQVAAAGSSAGTAPVVTPTAPAAEEEGGCAIAHSAGGNPLTWIALGLAGLLFGSRRRR